MAASYDPWDTRYNHPAEHRARPMHPPHPAQPHPYAQAPAPYGFYNAPSNGPSYAPSSPPPPPFPRPNLPASLMPGFAPSRQVPPPVRSSSNDLFFQATPQFSHPPYRHAQTAPPPAPAPYPPYGRQTPVAPLQPSYSSPALPYNNQPSASTSTSPPVPAYRQDSKNTPPYPSPPQPIQEEDDEVLQQILQLSEKESERLQREEDEELERALQASLSLGSPQYLPVRSPDASGAFTLSPTADQFDLPSSSPIAGPSRFPDSRSTSYSSNLVSQISEDEALARRLEQEEAEAAAAAAQEQQRVQQPQPYINVDTPAPIATPNPPPAPPPDLSSPPLYDDIVGPVPVPAPAPPPASLYPQQPSYQPHPAAPSRSTSPVSPNPSLGRSVSDRPRPPPELVADFIRPLGRSQSLGVGEASPTAGSSRPQSVYTNGHTITGDNASAASTVSFPSADPAPAPPPSATQYLDKELLLGLSLAFGTPTITPEHRLFEGNIPNVIELPYGKCPPFYIKAPNWRTILQLMARLSGTRLQPTMEAMAVVKTEMQLRIVVSFVKAHHASNDWHTVLYMTIDHPVPPRAPTGWKYRNGDPNTLPWSYSFSPLPAFLRDGADSALSKYYTIPATGETPLPALPITFPSLATYLASALDASRAKMHDSSSGMRRLAKMVDQFYPSGPAEGSLDDDDESGGGRGGMRARFKSFVGITPKPSRDRNAETYVLVTPFMADDHGH